MLEEQIIPLIGIIIAIAGIAIAAYQWRDSKRQSILQAYFDQMSELVIRKGSLDPISRVKARALTLSAFRDLDPNRNADVLRYLGEAELLEGERLLDKLDMVGVNLSKCSLRNAYLVEADLIETNLAKADLRGANLYLAKLNKAKLNKAKLSGAKLTHADLGKANLNKADLSKADLRGANLDGARLSGANLSGATYTTKRYDTFWPDGFNPKEAGAFAVDDGDEEE